MIGEDANEGGKERRGLFNSNSTGGQLIASVFGLKASIGPVDCHSLRSAKFLCAGQLLHPLTGEGIKALKDGVFFLSRHHEGKEP